MSNEEYWQRFLLPGEQTIHVFGVSGWYIFVFYLLPALMLTGFALGSLFVMTLFVSILILAVVLIMLVPALYLRFFVHFAVTGTRVMSREGIFHKKFITVDLPSITDITIHESFLERLLTRSGVVGINTAGSHHIELKLRHVSRPFDRRQDIYQHLQPPPQQQASQDTFD